MEAAARGDGIRTRDTAPEPKAAPPLLEDEADEGSIERGLTAAEQLLRGLPRGPRVRELKHRLDGYRRVLERWCAAGPKPTGAQRNALLECVIALLADIFAGSI
jgi:hypothetical protein